MAAFDDNIKNKGLLSGRGEEILRAREQRLTTRSPQEAGIFKKIEQDQKDLDAIMVDVQKGITARYDTAQALSMQIQEMKKAAESLAQQRHQAANKSFESDLKKLTSNAATNQDINQIKRSFESYGSSIDMAKSMSTPDLHRQVRINQRELQQQNAALTGISPGSQESAAALGRRDDIVKNIGTTQAAIDMQKKLGIDMEAHFSKASGKNLGIVGQQEERELARNVRANAYGTKQSVDANLEVATSKLVEAFGKLNEAIHTNDEAHYESAKKTYDEAEKSHGKLQQISSEMSRQGGGGGWQGNLAGAGSLMGSVGSVALSASNIYRYAGVTSEFTREQNRIGMANMANQRFDDMQGASRGDFSSLRRIQQGQYGEQVKRAQLIGGREQVAAGMDVAGLGVQAAGNVAQATAEGALAAGTLGASSLLGATNVGSAIAKGIDSTTGAARAGIDFYKDNTAVAEGLRAGAQQRELDAVRNKVGDYGGQRTSDLIQGLTTSTRGLGGNARESMLGDLTNPETINRLAKEAGISIEDLPRLTGMAKEGLGKSARASDIETAGIEARAGRFASPEQYLQARGQMTGAGGGGKDLEEIMKNAVANGMDSSKNIMQMVDATVALASTSAGAGVNTFAGAAEGVGKSIDVLRGLGVSENMATRAAQTAAQRVEGFADVKGADIPNAIQFAKLRQSFEGASTPELMGLQNMSMAEIRSLKGAAEKSPEEAKKFAVSMGVGNVEGITDLDKIKQLEDTRRSSDLMRVTGGPFMLGADKQQEIERKTAAGIPLSEEEQSQVNLGTRLTQGRGVSGVAEAGYLAGGEANKSDLIGKPGGIAGAGEDMKAATGVFDAKQFSTTMEKFGGSMEGFAKSFATVVENMPANYEKSAHDAADKLMIPINTFGTEVGKLTVSLKDLGAIIAGITGKSGPALPSTSSNMKENVDKALNKWDDLR